MGLHLAARSLARIGGHFDGAAVLHWPTGSDGRGALLTGDTITVVQDREWVSFMSSYPSHIPLDEATVLDIARRVERFTFDRVYGGWWGRTVLRDGSGQSVAPLTGMSRDCTESGLKASSMTTRRDGIRHRPGCFSSGRAGCRSWHATGPVQPAGGVRRRTVVNPGRSRAGGPCGDDDEGWIR